jgi:thioredoxin-related protein
MRNSAKTIASVALIAIGLACSTAVRADFRIESIDNDFQSEIQAAAEQGKLLVIMFHQDGCPYCDKMRARVFPDPKVDAFYSKHFVMIETDILGDLPVVTPQGEETTEKSFARKLRVRATPVFVYFDKEGNKALRLTGFMNAENFNKAGQYVLDGVYKTKTSFYRYVQSKQ